MALNTVDLVTMLPRTAEAAQVQGREQSQMQHAQDQPGIQFQEKTETEARQAVEAQKSETEEYDMNDGGGGGRGAGGNRGKKRGKQKKEPAMAPRSDSSFDIMV